MLIEIKDYWFIESSTITCVRLDVAGVFKKFPVIRIDTKTDKILLSDFETIEDLVAEFERLVSLFNEWEVFMNKKRTLPDKIINKNITKQIITKQAVSPK